MRVVVVPTVVVGVLASLAAVVRCDSDPLKTTSSPPPSDPDHTKVANRFCDHVVVTDTVHVPAFSDQHHRLLQVHVRTNIQVRTASITSCYLSISYL